MRYIPITNLAELNSRVKLGATPESLVLEFKREYAWQGQSKIPGHAAEIARDVAQFANTDGGVILVGVDEDEHPDGTKVAKSIVGVENVDGFIEWIEQALRNHLVPVMFSHPIERIRTPNGTVVAINIPPHPQLVAFWPQRSHGIEYLHRTNHGKDWMNPDEVERHMANELRAIQIDAKRIFAECQERMQHSPMIMQLDVVPPVAYVLEQGTGIFEGVGPSLERDHDAKPLLVAVDDYAVHLSFYGTGLNIPFALLRAIWRTADGRPAISLNARIVREPGTPHDRYYLDAL